MFMVVYPVLGILRPVCDCKLIRCVDLHTRSRPMFGQICNFVLFSWLSYYLGCFHYSYLFSYLYVYIHYLTHCHKTLIP